jgi:hypothetical protein
VEQRGDQTLSDVNWFWSAYHRSYIIDVTLLDGPTAFRDSKTGHEPQISVIAGPIIQAEPKLAFGNHVRERVLLIFARFQTSIQSPSRHPCWLVGGRFKIYRITCLSSPGADFSRGSNRNPFRDVTSGSDILIAKEVAGREESECHCDFLRFQTPSAKDAASSGRDVEVLHHDRQTGLEEVAPRVLAFTT